MQEQLQAELVRLRAVTEAEAHARAAEHGTREMLEMAKQVHMEGAWGAQTAAARRHVHAGCMPCPLRSSYAKLMGDALAEMQSPAWSRHLPGVWQAAQAPPHLQGIKGFDGAHLLIQAPVLHASFNVCLQTLDAERRRAQDAAHLAAEAAREQAAKSSSLQEQLASSQRQLQQEKVTLSVALVPRV